MGAGGEHVPASCRCVILVRSSLVCFVHRHRWTRTVFDCASGGRFSSSSGLVAAFVEIKFGTFLTQNPVGFLLSGITAAAQTASVNSPEQPIYLPDPLVTALGPQNLQNLWLIAEISNIGRLAVTVQGCQWHTAKGKTIERRPATPGVSFPHRLDANDQCIAVIDLRTIIAVLDAPFGETRTSGRDVWPIIRLGNRRTVKGKRIQIPVTSDPSQNTLKSEENPQLPFKLTVESGSNVEGRRGRAVVKGYIEQGSVSIGDKLELVSAQATIHIGECIGVGSLPSLIKLVRNGGLSAFWLVDLMRKMSAREMCCRPLRLTDHSVVRPVRLVGSRRWPGVLPLPQSA